ncbi:MAG: hypothetical protein ACP5P9_09215 [Acidimicrobiales bacterium]
MRLAPSGIVVAMGALRSRGWRSLAMSADDDVVAPSASTQVTT